MEKVPIAVTIEYPRVRQQERLHHLADEVGFEIIPLLTKPLPSSLTAESYAADLLRRLEGEDRPVGLVVAVCMAAPIGHQVARLLSGRCGVVPTLLALDGTPVATSDVIDAYRRSVVSYGRQQQAQVVVTEARLRERPADLLTAIRRELIEFAGAELLKESRRADLVAPIAAGAVKVSVEWIAHLIAAHNATFPLWDGEVVLVNSAESVFPGPWPGARLTRQVTVDCTTAELVGNPSVSKLLADEMASVSRA